MSVLQNLHEGGRDPQGREDPAHKKFINSPVDELPGMQKTIYDELPQSFETRTGLEVAERYGMPERTFKRWLSTSLFKKVTHGYYEKRYR